MFASDIDFSMFIASAGIMLISPSTSKILFPHVSSSKSNLAPGAILLLAIEWTRIAVTLCSVLARMLSLEIASAWAWE